MPNVLDSRGVWKNLLKKLTNWSSNVDDRTDRLQKILSKCICYRFRLGLWMFVACKAE